MTTSENETLNHFFNGKIIVQGSVRENITGVSRDNVWVTGI